MRNNLPNIIEESVEVDVAGEENKKKEKITFNDNVNEWTLKIFAKYFEYLYQFKFKKPYLPKKGDLKQLKRLLQVKDKETVKQYMKDFINLEFFKVKTLRIFCSNYTQSVLDNYSTNGNLPYYNKNISNEPEQSDEWSEEVDNIFGGDK